MQRLGWANGQSGNPTSTTTLPLCHPAAVVRQGEERQKKDQKKDLSKKTNKQKKNEPMHTHLVPEVCMHEFIGVQLSQTDSGFR